MAASPVQYKWAENGGGASSISIPWDSAPTAGNVVLILTVTRNSVTPSLWSGTGTNSVESTSLDITGAAGDLRMNGQWVKVGTGPATTWSSNLSASARAQVFAVEFSGASVTWSDRWVSGEIDAAGQANVSYGSWPPQGHGYVAVHAQAYLGNLPGNTVSPNPSDFGGGQSGGGSAGAKLSAGGEFGINTAGTTGTLKQFAVDTAEHGVYVVAIASAASGLTPVTDTLTLRHNVQAGVSKNLTLVHNIEGLAQVTDTLTLRHNVQAAVSDLLTLRHNVLQGVSDSVTLRHNVLVGVADSLTLRHNVQSGVSDSLSLVFNVLAEEALTPVTDSLTLVHNVQAGVSDSLTLRHNVLGGAQDSLTLRHNILSGVQDSLTLRHNVLAGVADTLTMRYNVLGTLAQVTKDLTLVYGVGGSVVDTLTLRHNVQAGVTDTLTVQHNILTSVLDALTLQHNVYQGVADALTLLHGIRAGVGDSFVLRLNVAGGVSDAVTLRLNVRTGINDSLALRFNTLGPTGIPIKIGSTNIVGANFGVTPVTKIYVGATQLWP